MIQTVPDVRWEEHQAWLSEHVCPGQHISVIVPTGGGKSYLIVKGLLSSIPGVRHARILFLDDKEGRDPSTRDFGQPIRRYPLSWRERYHHGEDDPQHYRLVLPDVPQKRAGVTMSNSPDYRRAQMLVTNALEAFYGEAEDPNDSLSGSKARASILVLDETAALTGSSYPSLNLAGLVKRGWRKGRYRGLSLIAATQAPLGVPSEFYHQSTHLYIGQMQDHEQRRRLREIGGNSMVIQEAVQDLDQHEFLFLGHKGRDMQIVKVGR